MLLAIGLTMMLFAPMTAIGGIIMALRQDGASDRSSLAIILPIMFVFVFVDAPRPSPLFHAIQSRSTGSAGHARDAAGVRVIRAFARMQYAGGPVRENRDQVSPASP